MILLTVGVLGLALFVVIELEVDAPLLNVRVFTHWPFTNSLLLVSVLSIGLFAVLFYIPLLLQQARGLGAFDTGLLLLPQALVMAVLMPSAGILYDRCRGDRGARGAIQAGERVHQIRALLVASTQAAVHRAAHAG